MNIYTVTVARVYNILIIFDSLLFFSLFSICTTNHPTSCSFFLWYTLPQTQNQKSTTKSTTRTKPFDRWSVIGDCVSWIGKAIWIGIDGDRWWVDEDRCWWRSILMEIGVDGVLEMGWWRSALMECLWWCFWVDGDWWIGEVLWCLWWLWCWWSPCSGASGFWPWEIEEERRWRKERGNGRYKRKRKKEERIGCIGKRNDR